MLNWLKFVNLVEGWNGVVDKNAFFFEFLVWDFEWVMEGRRI